MEAKKCIGITSPKVSLNHPPLQSFSKPDIENVSPRKEPVPLFSGRAIGVSLIYELSKHHTFMSLLPGA